MIQILNRFEEFETLFKYPYGLAVAADISECLHQHYMRLPREYRFHSIACIFLVLLQPCTKFHWAIRYKRRHKRKHMPIPYHCVPN